MRNRIQILCLLVGFCALVAWPAVSLATEEDGNPFEGGTEVYSVPPSMVSRHNGECKRITRQIARYADTVDLARERGNEMWEDATLDHIGRLAERREKLCPTLYLNKPIGQELAKILKGAAKIAMKLFTMGML